MSTSSSKHKRFPWPSLSETLADVYEKLDGPTRRTDSAELGKTDPPDRPQVAIVTTPHARPRERRSSTTRSRASPSSDDPDPSHPSDAPSDAPAASDDRWPLALAAYLLTLAGISFEVAEHGLDADACPSCGGPHFHLTRLGPHCFDGCSAAAISHAFTRIWHSIREDEM